VDEGQHVGIIKEDEKGWQGHSDLIAICLASAFQFLIGRGADVHVALVLNSSVADYHFVPILGPSMRVYDTSITDRQNLHLLRTLPGDAEGPASVLQEPPQQLECPKTIPLALCRDQSLDRLTIRTKFTDELESRDLQNQKLKVKIVQEGPCAMRITFGTHSQVLAFPFPVDGAYSKTTIVRRKSWIEVTVPLSSPIGSHGYNMRPFPVISAGGYLNCWGLGRFNLAKQPILPLSTARRYLSGFLGMTLSEAEHKTRQNPSAVTDSTRVLLELKESLAAIMLSFIGQGNKAKDVTRRYSAFRLAKDNDSDLLIFANSLRHDRDSGSVCLDAYVVPLTDKRIRHLANALRRAVSEQHLMSIRLSEDESVVWKRLIPALIERCRLRWSHGRNCEYGSLEPVCPLSVLHGEMPICTCGEGQDVDGVPPEYAGFRNFATRIAIPALSAVPFRETMIFDSVLQSAEIPSSSIERHPGTLHGTGAGMASCDHCDASRNDLKACAGCGRAKYCDKDCQRKGWKHHKGNCNREISR